MDQIKDKGARLRRTFHYPNEDDDSNDSQPEAIDEQGPYSYLDYLLLSTRCRPPTKRPRESSARR